MKGEYVNGWQARFLTVSVAAGVAQSERVAFSVKIGHLTHVYCRGRRPDVTFIESLILEFDHTVQTRRSNRSITSVGLIVTISPGSETFARALQTDLQRLFRVPEWTIDSHVKHSPAVPRKMLEPRPRKPSWNVFDLGLDHQRSAQVKKSGTGQTYWERVNKECARNHGPFCILRRTFCGLKEFIFVRLDIQTVCNIHHERAGCT